MWVYFNITLYIDLVSCQMCNFSCRGVSLRREINQAIITKYMAWGMKTSCKAFHLLDRWLNHAPHCLIERYSPATACSRWREDNSNFSPSGCSSRAHCLCHSVEALACKMDTVVCIDLDIVRSQWIYPWLCLLIVLSVEAAEPVFGANNKSKVFRASSIPLKAYMTN